MTKRNKNEEPSLQSLTVEKPEGKWNGLSVSDVHSEDGIRFSNNPSSNTFSENCLQLGLKKQKTMNEESKSPAPQHLLKARTVRFKNKKK